MRAEERRLDIIIPTRNNRDHIIACLEALARAVDRARRIHGLTVHTWLVDNASDDGTPQLVRQTTRWVRVLTLERNAGFAHAVNTAAQHTRGDLWLLNPDTRPTPESLSLLLRRLYTAPDIGAVGPALLQADGRPAADGARGEPTLLREWADKVGLTRRYPGMWGYHLGRDLRERDVPVLSGAALLIRRQAWDQVHGLDERFWLYGEDTDVCVRLRAAGWRCTYVPDARVHHLRGGSARPEERLTLGLVALVSMYRYFAKHKGPSYARAYGWTMKGLALIKWAYWRARGRPEHVRVQQAILRARLTHYPNL
ncbi:MAG: glycosyltransferase family 2 protein [Chloroflexi bacterium]|nr:glycosyltransferase family 2 protein [Chloroflexota bacterium]